MPDASNCTETIERGIGMENKIREAMSIMAQRGHAKYSRCDNEGRVCVAGALSLALSGRPIPIDVDTEQRLSLLNEVGAVALEQYPDRATQPDMWGQGHPAVAFNNHPDTTLVDMCNVMEKAAIRLDERV